MGTKPVKGAQPVLGGGASGGQARATAGAAAPADASGGQALAALLTSLGQPAQEQQRPSMGLATPSFAAAPVLAGGGHLAPSSGRREAPGAALAQQLAAIKTLPATDAPAESAAKDAPAGAAASSGGVTSAPAIAAGGGYMGTQGVAKSLASVGFELGLKATSEKRHNTNPYSGSRSDHDLGNKDAYAYDISNGSAPTPEMDETAFAVMHELGFTDYKKGTPINTSSGVKVIHTPDGSFRVQVIYRGAGAAFGGDHTNHVHIGVKRVGK